MTVFTNAPKSTTTFSNTRLKSAASWDEREKSGQGWQYNEPNLMYNAVLDPDSGDIVYYNGFGSTTIWANRAKA